MHFLRCSLCLAVLLCCSDLFAQNDADSTLPAITISATRSLELPLNLPYSTGNISQKQIQEQLSRSTVDALTGATGVFLQKTNHGGGAAFIRGLTGNQILTLIDGVRLNNATFRYGPNQYLNTIDVFTIDKIEVVRGSGSVQYGTDALGGVVQIFTKDPAFKNKPEWQGAVTGKLMTQNMEKTLRGTAGFSNEKLALIAGYSYKIFGDLWGGDTTGRQIPSGYKENAFDAKLKLALPRSWVLKAMHQSVLQSNVPLYHKVTLENYAISKMEPQNRHLTYLTLEKNFTHPWIESLSLTASYQASREGRINQKFGSDKQTRELDIIKTTGITADFLHRFNPYWTANSGIELYIDHINSGKTEIYLPGHFQQQLRGLYPDHSKYYNASVYSLHHLKYSSWIFEAGIRYNSITITLFDSSLGKVRNHPAAVVANAGILKKLGIHNSLFLNYSKGFRAPNIDDMGTLGIVDFRYELPTKSLQPEYADNYEWGYKHESAQTYANFSLFYSRLHHLITRQQVEGQVIDNYPVYQKLNTEKAHLYGVEVDVGLQITRYISTQLNAAYTYGQNDTKHEPLRRVPPLNGRWLVVFEKEKYFSKLELLAASKQSRLAKGDVDDNRIPKGGTPGWEVLNLYGGYYFENWLLNASIQNIFNQDYRAHGSGINGLGRSAYIGVSFQF